MANGLGAQRLKQIEHRLRTREQELLQGMRREPAQRREHARLNEEVPDAGDASVADLIIDVDHAGHERDLTELRMVREALGRLDEEDFGICMVCGAPMPFERLRAAPTARRCVRCQSMLEKTYAAFRPGPTL